MFSNGSNVTLQGHEEIVEYLVIIMPNYTMLKVPVYTHNKAPQHEPISLVLTLPNLGDTRVAPGLQVGSRLHGRLFQCWPKTITQKITYNVLVITETPSNTKVHIMMKLSL